MARLRTPAPVTTAPADFPAELRRGAVAVATFVPDWESPPPYRRTEDERRWWRLFTAWRRWQHATARWGQEHGLDRKALMAMNVWPSSPLWVVDREHYDLR